MYNYSIVEYKIFDMLDDLDPSIRSVAMFDNTIPMVNTLEDSIRKYYYTGNHHNRFFKKEFMIYKHDHNVVIYGNTNFTESDMFVNIICGVNGINIVGIGELMDVIMKNEFISGLNELYKEIMTTKALSKNKLIKKISNSGIAINTNLKFKETILKDYENFLKGNYFLFCKDL